MQSRNVGLINLVIKKIMKTKTYSYFIQCGIACCSLLLANTSHAVTSLISTSKYSVSEGVAFSLGNNGA